MIVGLHLRAVEARESRRRGNGSEKPAVSVAEERKLPAYAGS